MVTRPSEALTATVGSIVGALLVVLASFTKVTVSAEMAGVIVLAVSWIATAVTYFTAKAQRSGTLTSGPAGEVQS